MTVKAAGRDCVLGIDVSRWQPSIDWRAVAGCRQFAVIKASGGDGGTYGDSMYGSHRDRSAGLLPRGAYHFLGDGNGAQQAAFFMAATGGYAGLELPPVVDIETYSGRRPSLQTVRDFDNELHRQLGRRWTGPHGDPVALIAYTGAPLASSLPPELARLDLWLAAYLNPYYGNPWAGVTNGPTPNVAALGAPDRYVPRPFNGWGAWQFAGGDGGCPGVGNGVTNCDQNVMDVAMFNRLTGGTTTSQGDFDMPYTDWPTEQKWALSRDVAGVTVGEDLTGKDAPSVTPAKIWGALVAQQAINAAILTKLGIPFHYDQGALVLD